MKIATFLVPIVILSGCVTGGGLTGSGGATEISLGDIDRIESTGLASAPFRATINGTENLLVKIGSDGVYLGGGTLYRFAISPDGKSFAASAHSLYGDYYGSYLSANSVDLPSSGLAEYYGSYAGEVFLDVGSIDVIGDAYVSANFDSSDFEGMVSNRYVYSYGGAYNTLLEDPLIMAGDINSDGSLSGFVYNDNAYGFVDGIFFGNADGIVGAVVLTQENSYFGSPRDFTEIGAFTVD